MTWEHYPDWKAFQHQNWKKIQPKKITPEELLVRYDNGERDFSGIDLVLSSEAFFVYTGIELRGLVLRNIVLRGAILQEVDMREIDLSGADLGGIFLENCNLHKATIQDANLRGACLHECTFNDVDLRGSNLNYINASFSSFRRAKLSSFENAILVRTNFEGATIDDSVSNSKICFYFSNNFLYNTILPDGSEVREAKLC
jgi:uncharacterized protein YjbI with pentapeptide repeats